MHLDFQSFLKIAEDGRCWKCILGVGQKATVTHSIYKNELLFYPPPKNRVLLQIVFAVVPLPHQEYLVEIQMQMSMNYLPITLARAESP